jgi:hypothetical protein
MLALAGSVLAILVCGGLGAVTGWLAMRALGLDGTLGSLLAAFVAMVVATLAWIAGSVVLRRLRLLR